MRKIWVPVDFPELQGTVREKWIQKDKEAEYYFHKFFLMLALLVRITLIPWLFVGTHPAFQMGASILFEIWVRRMRIEPYISYDFNIWHRRDVWATFFQVAFFVIAITVPTITIEPAGIMSMLLFYGIEKWLFPETIVMKMFNTLVYLSILSMN